MACCRKLQLLLSYVEWECEREYVHSIHHVHYTVSQSYAMCLAVLARILPDCCR